MKARSGVGALASDIEGQLERLRADGLDVDNHIRPLVVMSEQLRLHLASMDKQLRELASAHPVCSEFPTVPGVGPITSLSFYRAIGDPWRFARNRDVGPYLGLTPSILQSGGTSQVGRISRFGNKLTRSHLVAAGMVLLCSTKAERAFRSWGFELSRKIGLRKARAAVARKLAVVMPHIGIQDRTSIQDIRELSSSHGRAGLDPVEKTGRESPLNVVGPNLLIGGYRLSA